MMSHLFFIFFFLQGIFQFIQCGHILSGHLRSIQVFHSTSFFKTLFLVHPEGWLKDWIRSWIQGPGWKEF